jgi:hypothetical protein
MIVRSEISLSIKEYQCLFLSSEVWSWFLSIRKLLQYRLFECFRKVSICIENVSSNQMTFQPVEKFRFVNPEPFCQSELPSCEIKSIIFANSKVRFCQSESELHCMICMILSFVNPGITFYQVEGMMFLNSNSWQSRNIIWAIRKDNFVSMCQCITCIKYYLSIWLSSKILLYKVRHCVFCQDSSFNFTGIVFIVESRYSYVYTIESD